MKNLNFYKENKSVVLLMMKHFISFSQFLSPLKYTEELSSVIRYPDLKLSQYFGRCFKFVSTRNLLNISESLCYDKDMLNISNPSF